MKTKIVYLLCLSYDYEGDDPVMVFGSRADADEMKEMCKKHDEQNKPTHPGRDYSVGECCQYEENVSEFLKNHPLKEEARMIHDGYSIYPITMKE